MRAKGFAVSVKQKGSERSKRLENSGRGEGLSEYLRDGRDRMHDAHTRESAI